MVSSCTVHPRMCGERKVCVDDFIRHGGSSPHVRGTRARQRRGLATFRFIPACAGNATTWPTGRGGSPVHPRMCGERSSQRSIASLNVGSSPHVRGTPACRARPARRRRFIPACAGNASRSPTPRSPSAVHPRMCGERNPGATMPGLSSGSSPHVRGTLGIGQRHCHPPRFIPACAGNAAMTSSCNRSKSVHPRMCGERRLGLLATLRQHGSSPHVRGTHPVDVGGLEHERFIPACAGNASRCSPCCRTAPVHPRMCGERGDVRSERGQVAGSSPHVRGTRGDRELGRLAERFIPACAGNATVPASSLLAMPVHPRMCGERNAIHPVACSGVGSSPHVRGTRAAQLLDDVLRRFIPACAGNAG